MDQLREVAEEEEEAQRKSATRAMPRREMQDKTSKYFPPDPCLPPSLVAMDLRSISGENGHY